MKNQTNEYVEALKYDKRLLEINFKNGLITREEYSKVLDQLPDRAENATNLTLEDEEDTNSPRPPEAPAATEPAAPTGGTDDINGSGTSTGWNDNPFNSTY